MKKYKSCFGLVLGMILLLNGCSVEKTDGNKLRDLNFSILEESQIPKELLSDIEVKKANEFKITFDTQEERYIAAGYGAQPTNGYSIAVDELYETSNAIYINTNLIGPAKGETVSEVESYPYIVVKIQYIDKSVVFE